MGGRGASGWRRTIEEYTPDGTVGRLLFGAVVGAPSVYVGVFGLAVLFGSTGIGGLGAAVAGLVFTALGLAGGAAALAVLWPVYLSLIGNVETPADYGPPTADEESPMAVLKRRYAAGELSQAEFERKADELLEYTDPDHTARDRQERITEQTE